MHAASQTLIRGRLGWTAIKVDRRGIMTDVKPNEWHVCMSEVCDLVSMKAGSMCAILTTSYSADFSVVSGSN